MNLIKDLVTLIIPFYNAEDFLERCLEAVINQTYKSIQLILINDGSIDRSETIVNNYIDNLRSVLADVIYIEKENGGAASAVNVALKHVNGEYLVWADADDVMHSDNIKRKYDFLQKHREYGMVLCGAQSINSTTGQFIKKLCLESNRRTEDLFSTIIDGIPCYSGVFMVRTESLFKIIPNRNIYYHPEIGQNYQLLLPVAYFNKCGFIEDVLYDVYIRSESHSHSSDYFKDCKRVQERETALEAILDFMPDEAKKCLMEDIHNKSLNRLFQLAFKNNDKEKCVDTYRVMKQLGIGVSHKEIIQYYFIKNSFLNLIYRKLKG